MSIKWREPITERTEDFLRTHWNSEDDYYRVTLSECLLGKEDRLRPVYYATTVHYGVETRLISRHQKENAAKDACELHGRTQHRAGLRVKESRAIKRARNKDRALRVGKGRS